MSKWVRVPGTSGVERLSLVFRRDKDAEICDWIASLPYGRVSAEIRAVLLAHIRSSGGGRITPPAPPAPSVRAPSPPVVTPVGAAAVAPLSVPAAPIPATPVEGAISPEDMAVLNSLADRFS